MGNKISLVLLLALLLLYSCGETNENSTLSGTQQKSPISDEGSDTEMAENSLDISDVSSDIPDSSSAKNESSADASEFSDFSEDIDISIPEPTDSYMVLVADYIPNIKTDIRYATENNFTGKVIYDSADAYLRYGTVKKLAAVQAELNELGYELLIWDAYRPTLAQWKLWEICPDGNFVSDPNKGYSSHSRGNTVDITILRTDGTELEMPSEFDEFTALADRDYSDVSKEAAENSQLLEDIMQKNGFSGYRKEWWHYSDNVKYDVIE